MEEQQPIAFKQTSKTKKVFRAALTDIVFKREGGTDNRIVV